MQPALRKVGDAGEHVGQPGERIDIVEFCRGRDETEALARLKTWNRPIHWIRGRIEKIFGTWKRSYGPRRMRWSGLAKAAVQVRLTAIAYNFKRGLAIVAAA